MHMSTSLGSTHQTRANHDPSRVDDGTRPTNTYFIKYQALQIRKTKINTWSGVESL
jgi:hypothetical protein